MEKNKIYIASSWKNRHAVEMLTFLLRERYYEVVSFIENENGEDLSGNFNEWIKTPDASKSFYHDVKGATESDFVIYIAPSGKDAIAECGMAYAKDIPLLGLHAKGEDLGLMRKMFTAWFDNYYDLLDWLRMAKPNKHG